MKAILIRAHGGPDVLEWADIDLPAPGPNEVRVRQRAVGLNFSDINVRSGGFYVTGASSFPIVLGNEAAGTIEAIGAEVTGWRIGERVAYVGTGGLFFENTGAYAQERNVPADCLVRLPDDIDDLRAAALLLKGLTASLIVHRCFRPGPGDTVLIHAAASGVGTLLAQWCRDLGATVIGTAGSTEKAAFARAHGCDHVVLYREVDFVAAVRALAPGGVSAVFDGVGKDTFVPSFDVVRPFGALVNYGNASGAVPPFPLILLAQKGCLVLHRPGFGWHANSAATRQSACDELFEMTRRGKLHVEVCATYPLERAADAHRAVEAGRTTGSVVLVP